MNQNDRSALRGPLGASLAALVIIVIFLLIMMPGVYRSTLTVFGGHSDPSDGMDDLIAAHNQNMETDIDRFNGRSLFYLPPVKRRPPPPPPPPKPVDDSPPPPPPPPPKPTYPANYTGPKLIAILGDEAWFRKNSSELDPTTRIKAGCVQHGIEVISTDAPRSVRVKYNDGGPYEVALIDLDADPFESSAALILPRGVLEATVDPDDDDSPCPPEQIPGVHVPIDENAANALDDAPEPVEDVPTQDIVGTLTPAPDTTPEAAPETTPPPAEDVSEPSPPDTIDAPEPPQEPQSPGTLEPPATPEDPELNEDEPGLPD